VPRKTHGGGGQELDVPGARPVRGETLTVFHMIRIVIILASALAAIFVAQCRTNL
jgi:hypothetical protein